MKKRILFPTPYPAIIKISGYLLASIIGLISTTYASLLWKVGDVAHLGMSALFGLAVGSLVWEKRHSFKAESHSSAVLLGTFIILLGSILPFLFDDPALLRLMPLICAVGLALVASGFHGVRQHWRELTILFFLMVPKLIVEAISDVSYLTAKFSAFALWYLGFDVSLEGVHIILPKGSIQVYEACSGLESMAYLLGLSVICLLLFPLALRSYQIIVPLIGITLGFVVNALRIMLLVVLIAQDKAKAFDYWHDGDGSLVVGMVGALLLGTVYFFLLSREDMQVPESAEKI